MGTSVSVQTNNIHHCIPGAYCYGVRYIYRQTRSDIYTIIGAICIASSFLGNFSSGTVQPIVGLEAPTYKR